MIAGTSPARQPRCAARLLGVLAGVALALSGCAGAAPSVPTSDVFVSAPWRAGERLEYRLRNDQGDALGTAILTTAQDGDRYVLGQVYEEDPGRVPAGAAAIRDEVRLVVDGRTLKPLEGTRITRGRQGDGQPQETRVVWTYRATGESTTLVTRREGAGGRLEESTLPLREHAYDNESSLWLWRGVALAEGYEEAYVSASALDRTQQTAIITVPQRERVEVPAGAFEAWRILLRSGRAVRTAWIGIEAPSRVVRWDTGEVIFELVKAD